MKNEVEISIEKQTKWDWQTKKSSDVYYVWARKKIDSMFASDSECLDVCKTEEEAHASYEVAKANYRASGKLVIKKELITTA